MDAGANAARTNDVFDRIGDAVGNVTRDGAQRLVDQATVFSPLVGVTRAIADPEGAKQSLHRVGQQAFDALSILNPGIGIARWLTGTDSGRRAAQVGAKGAVDLIESPLTTYGLARTIVDTATAHPQETRRAAQTAFDIATVFNPGIAMARGIASIFHQHD